MTVTSLRRFLSLLLVTFFLASGITAEPQQASTETDLSAQEQNAEGEQQELSPEQVQQLVLLQALQSEFAEEEQALQAEFEQYGSALSEEQQSFLGLLVHQYGLKMALICLNAETESEAFARCCEQNGLTKEAALELQQHLVSMIEKEQIPLDAAQGLISLQAKGSDLQQRMMQRAQELAAGAPQKTSTKKTQKTAKDAAQEKLDAAKLDAQQFMRGMRHLKNMFLHDPEEDAVQFEAILETHNTLSKNAATLPELLATRTQIMAQLEAMGLSKEHVKEAVLSDKKDIVTQIMGMRSHDERDMIFHNPETDLEFFKKIAKKRTNNLAEASDEHVAAIPVESIIQEQAALIEELKQHGISLADALPIVQQLNSEETSKNIKNFVAAASSSFLFGAAEYCTKAATVETPVANSAWNWLLEPWGFYEHVTDLATTRTPWIPKFTWLASARPFKWIKPQEAATDTEFGDVDISAILSPTRMLQNALSNFTPLGFLSWPSSWSIFHYNKPATQKVKGRLWGENVEVKKDTATTPMLPRWVPGFIRNRGLFQYHKEVSRGDGSKWVWSEAGFNAKALQALALFPTGYLFKNEQTDTILSEVLQLSPSGVKKLKTNPLYKSLVWPVAAAIPVAMGQHQELANQTFQSVAGAKGGRLLHLLFSKILPFGAYATYFLHDKKVSGLKAAVQELGMNDTDHNAATIVARTSMPVAEMVVGHKIDSLIRTASPKNNAFLRTFLCSGWGTHAAHIASGSVWRKLLWDQYKDKDNAFLKVNLEGKKPLHVDKGKTLRYYQSNTPGISSEEFNEITGMPAIKVEHVDDGSTKITYLPQRQDSTVLPNGQPIMSTPQTSREAWTTYAKRSTAELVVEEGTVAATSAALHAVNSPVVRFGKKVGSLVSDIAKKHMSEEVHEGVGEFIDNAQNNLKLLACFVKMVMDSTSNFKALVALHPERLPQMFVKLTKNPEQLRMYTKFAQAQTHKMFAEKLYQYFLKNLVRSLLQKNWAKNNLKVGKYLKTETPVKRNALWTSAKWIAFITAYVSATTTLSEPIKKGLDFEDIIKSFNESEDEDETGSDQDESGSTNSGIAPVAA